MIYNENCIETIKRFDNKSIDGIITSPPYNISVKRKDNYYNNGYADIDCLSEEDYLNKRIEEFIGFSRILKDNGVILYNISYSKNSPMLPLLLMNKVHNETDLTVVDIISWKKKTSLPLQSSKNRLSRIVELIYVIVKKSDVDTFNTNKKVTKINKRTGQKFYKKYVNFIEADNNDGFKSELKACFSQHLVGELIRIYFPANSKIYDPFIGIGTTALACIDNGCYYIGSEINKNFFNIAINRIMKRVSL